MGDQNTSGQTSDDDDIDEAADSGAVEAIDLTEDEEQALAEPASTSNRVAYSTTDFDVEGLVRRLKRGDIIVPTFGLDDESIETAGFQRRFVWRRPQMDRFIESLLMGYPIPGIFLVEQTDKRYLVLDGQQRLKTLQAFYAGVHDRKEFSLRAVAGEFEDLVYESLSPEMRRTLDNTFVQATIVRTDGSTDSLDTIYQIFERLNSGGTQLTPHEIRVALYAGPFIEFLSRLNSTASWRDLYGKPSPRLRDQEIALRFAALYTAPGDYRRPLKKYLNDFASTHRELDSLDTTTLENRFSRACELLHSAVGPNALRLSRSVNAALTEALLIGLARRLDVDEPVETDKVTAAVSKLLNDNGFVQSISQATADEENVRRRIGLSSKALAAT